MREIHLLNFSVGISVLPSHNLSCFTFLSSLTLTAPRPHHGPLKLHAFKQQVVYGTSKKENHIPFLYLFRSQDLLAFM